MKHEEFEQQMFAHVNKNCKMKELDRQEVARAAQEERQFTSKCEKFNAVICIIVLLACFVATGFAACALSYIGFNPTFATGVAAVAGLMFGLAINSMVNKIKK